MAAGSPADDRIAAAVKAIRERLGESGLINGAQAERYLHDHLGRFQGKALMIARPASTADVAAVVTLCAQAGIAIVCQGGNTGYCGGATPDDSGTQLLLSLERMRAVRELDAVNFTVTVEAGAVLAEVQRVASEAGRFFPLSLGSEGSCTIGGNLATNAGGTAVLRYGNASELVLGLEVVLPDGQIWNGLRKLRKDNAGYDLKRLFLGAEGTLGVITAAVLKLFPLPAARSTALLAVPSPQAACSLLGLAREVSGDAVVSFEYLPRHALNLVLQHIPGTRDPLDESFPHYVLVELAGAGTAAQLDEQMQALFAAGMDSNELLSGVVAQSEAQRTELWRLRESVPEAQRHAGGSLKHDVSVPTSAIPELLERGIEAARQIEARAVPCAYGHLGDGNLHFNFHPPAGQDLAEFLGDRGAEISAALHTLVLSMGGSVCAEHGVGQSKRALLAATADPVEMALMRKLKNALDPAGLMNPGKVLSQ